MKRERELVVYWTGGQGTSRDEDGGVDRSDRGDMLGSGVSRLDNRECRSK